MASASRFTVIVLAAAFAAAAHAQSVLPHNIDWVLGQQHPSQGELQEAIDKAERLVTVYKTTIPRINEEADEPAQVPSSYWNDIKSYERIATRSCNKSIVDEEHVALEPAEDLCLRIFQSDCFSSLSETNRGKIRRCPSVYRHTATKSYRIGELRSDIAKLESKIAAARSRLNTRVEERRDGKTVQTSPVKSPGEAVGSSAGNVKTTQ